MAKFQKGDYRRRDKPSVLAEIGKALLIFFKWIIAKIRHGEEKSFYLPASSGPNRHERRVEAKRQRTVFALKGRPGFKLIRRMFRKYGVETVSKLMRGTYQLRSKAIAKTAFYRARNKKIRSWAKDVVYHNPSL